MSRGGRTKRVNVAKCREAWALAAKRLELTEPAGSLKRVRVVIEHEGRAPDWPNWKHLKTAALWHCVALSLNIDPRKVRHHPQAWMTGGPRRQPARVFLETQCFNDRWFFAQRAVADNLVGPLRWEARDAIVELASFAKWALSVGWSMPAELSSLASESRSSTIGAETIAVTELVQVFDSDPDCRLSKAACIAKLSNAELGKRALERVWQRATEERPSRRKAGRKKSNHPAK